MICSSSVEEVGNGLEEEVNGKLGEGKCELVVVEAMHICMASHVVVVVEENGKLGVGEGKCELVVGESGRLGEGEGKCELVVEEMSTCNAS